MSDSDPGAGNLCHLCFLTEKISGFKMQYHCRRIILRTYD